MAEEEKREQPDQPEAEAAEPEAEAPESTEPAAEAPEAAEPEAEAPDAAEPESDTAADETAAAEPEPAEESVAESEDSKGKGPEESRQPPGAELDPIALEPERELTAEERARVEAEAEERARLEAEATAEAGEEPAAPREPKIEVPSDARIQATGKRKSSIARVVLRSGSGEFKVNERGLEEYFPRHYHQTMALQPLVASGYEGNVDVRVRVHGGGITGQAGAVRHGIARALCEIDPELRGELKRRGLLTRDARIKERRKAGLKKARKRPQFSKR
jgi:small subunit ribosomal protein S9